MSDKQYQINPLRGFDDSAGVAATALHQPERRFRFTAKVLRLGTAGLLIISFGVLFFSEFRLPELAWLLAGLSVPGSLVAPLLARAERRKSHLPLRLPQEADRKDPADPAPGGGLRKARGTIYLGNCRATKQEAWLAQDDCLRHMLVLGTTGSGKTASLMGIAANMLANGGGLIYSDAKGSTELYFQVYGLAQRLGRDDDCLVMNYQTAQEAHPGEKRSNSLNLFQGRSYHTLLQIFLSLLPGAQGEGSNAVFSQRAESLMAALLPPLVWLRDNENWALSLRLLSDCLSLDGVIGLASVSRIPDTEIGSLHAFIESLAGMNAQIKPNGQPQLAGDAKISPSEWYSALKQAEAIVLSNRDVMRAGRHLKRVSGWVIPDQSANQHGFASMYFNRPVQSLTVTYSDLYDSPWGEIRLEDVIAQRRILTIVLPVLEKSPAELRGLGKLVLSSIRSAVALGLGSRAEGLKSQVIDNLPTRSETISLIILDEVAYQLTEGFAAVAAQARSLGVGVIFAGQDLAGIRRAGQEEAGQVIANTLSKVFMRLAEPDDTASLAIKLGGKIQVRIRTGPNGAEYREQERISAQDLTDQIEGQSHIIFGSNIVRTNMFYPGATTADLMMMRRFVNIPSNADLKAIHDRAQTTARTQTARDRVKGGPKNQQQTAQSKPPMTAQPGMPPDIHKMFDPQKTKAGSGRPSDFDRRDPRTSRKRRTA